MNMKIEEIQSQIREQELEGWLLADFHARNEVAVTLLGLTGIVTRRSFYFIPAHGEPTALVAPIERDKFAHLPGRMIPYFGYRELERELSSLLSTHRRVAMEYSPKGRLPYVAYVDAGTFELVQSLGIEIVSSADLVASVQARLSDEQIVMHRKAAANLIEIKDEAFEFIAKSLQDGQDVTEYDVQQFIMKQFDSRGMVTRFPPNCSVDANAGNPHYEPTAKKSALLKRGQLVLIDLWAKLKHTDAIYGDITWMAFTGAKREIPQKYVRIFDVIRAARDAAVEFTDRRILDGPVRGCEVDDVCRRVVEDAGFGEYFSHRTGHSITTSEHGPGPNIDNLEAEDQRFLQRGHLFSIEPGVYMEDCGLRTEIDCLIVAGGCEVTTLPLQKDIMPLG